MSQQTVEIPKRMLQIVDDIVVDTPISPCEICRNVLSKPKEPEKTLGEMIADATTKLLEEPVGIRDLIGKRIIRITPLNVPHRDIYLDGAFCMRSAGGTGTSCTLTDVTAIGSLRLSYNNRPIETLSSVWDDGNWVEYIEGVTV